MTNSKNTHELRARVVNYEELRTSDPWLHGMIGVACSGRESGRWTIQGNGLVRWAVQES